MVVGEVWLLVRRGCWWGVVVGVVVGGVWLLMRCGCCWCGCW